MAIIANRVKIVNKHHQVYRSLASFSKKCLASILLVISLYLIHANSSFSKKISAISLEITGPFMAGNLKIYEFLINTITYLPKKISATQNLQAENEILKTEILQLKNRMRTLQNIDNENEHLKKLLNVVADKKFNYLSARLLSVATTPFGSTALIGAGSREKIAINQIVTNNVGLVGKIIEVSDNYAKVMLVNDYNSRIPVVTSITATKGILIGEGKNSQIAYLPENHLITLAEEIFTSGDGEIYPPGIFIARIKKINQQNVFVEPVNNLADNKFVIVHIPDPKN